MREVLVVGGAGYIGSHMVNMLLDSGMDVVTLDNLSQGHREAVLGGAFVEGDLADRALLDRVFEEHDFDGVMHFAANALVGESVTNPGKYYRNNVANTLNLLEVMASRRVLAFIFSSTCAVYGEPRRIPIDESHECAPINPYGRSKRMVEQILGDFDAAFGLKSVCLRYFNAAGADPEGRIGENHDPETHLIPLVLQAASGHREHISILGTDYGTPDGTCIRDYIHVADLCQAHLLALQRLLSGEPSAVFNLGNGQGFSVQQVIDTAKEVTGRPITVVPGPRRPGDPERLIANSTRARTALGWSPRYPDLATIIQHAWQWEQRRRGR
jgi:UDP-glucose 4-epimerase